MPNRLSLSSVFSNPTRFRSTVMSGDSSGREGACYRRAAVDAEDDRTEIDPRANPWAMLAALPLFAGLPKSVVDAAVRSEEHTSELQYLRHIVCSILLLIKQI